MLMKFKVISDLATAEYWWRFFSTDQSIFGNWEYRYCFYKYFNYEIFFYIGYVNDKPVGLMPLQYNFDKKYLEFFGGSAMENNQIFILPGYECYISEFYNILDKACNLEYIIGDDAFTVELAFQEFKYKLSLLNFKNTNDYIEFNFHGETKKKLKKRIRRVTEENKIEIFRNQFSDLDLLFDFNIARFKDQSIFNWPHRKDIFRNLTKASFPVILLTFMVNNEKQAVSIGAFSGNTCTFFNSGISPNAVKDLSSYITLYKIDCALAGGAELYDAMSDDCGWKEKWGFTKIPQYKFEKNVV